MSSRWTAKELSRTYTRVLSPSNSLPSRLPHDPEQSCLCCIVGPCWLPIWNRAVCTCPSQTPRLSLPSILPARGLPVISALSRLSPVETLTLDSFVYSGLPDCSLCVPHEHCVCKTWSGREVATRHERSGSTLRERALWWGGCWEAELSHRISQEEVTAWVKMEKNSLPMLALQPGTEPPRPLREGFSLRPAVAL